MKKLFVLIMLVALLSIPVFAITPPTYKTAYYAPRRYGVERVTHYDPRVNFANVVGTIYLAPAQIGKFEGVGRGGEPPFYARGTARFGTTTWYGYPRTHIQIKTKDLEPSDKIYAQYEAWLVDDDSEYRLSIGTFTTLFGGTGFLDYNLDNSVAQYDRIEVTIEPYNDLDLAPGPVVLIGKIPEGYYFAPKAKQAKMNTNVFRSY